MAAEERDSILASGQRLDRYELLTPIASGGMASVWLARLLGKRGFEKLVAIKTIRTEFSDDPRFEEMFLDEARIASGIQHPNVAQITDLGEERGILYIVMEWVDGESLAKLRKAALKRGIPIPLGVALRVLADACAGLHAAHELKDQKGENLGIVHRDISPHNILVSSTGVVKVIDFGIAKAKNRMAKETGTGVVKGKVAYMAREQAMGVDVDRRVDIWAIGVCLYELIAGELPFDGDNQLEIFQNVISLNKRPYIEGATPAVIDDILDKALARIPEDRYRTAAAMERALEEAIQALGVDGSAEAVADFVQANLADRIAKRQELVHRALESAARRVLPNSVSEIDLHTDDFRVISSVSGPPSFEEAPTVAAGKLVRDEEPEKITTEIPVAERTAAPMPLKKTASDDRVSHARESIAPPPERKAYLEMLLIAAAGVIAFLMWRQQNMQQPAAPAAPAPIESTSASASATPSVVLPPSASLSAAPSVSVAPSVSASVTASGSVQPQPSAALQKLPPPPSKPTLTTAKPEPPPVASTPPPPLPSATAPPDDDDPYPP